MTLHIKGILKPKAYTSPQNPLSQKKVYFKETVTIKAIANDCFKTFHLPLDQLVHTIEDVTLFFHVKPPTEKKALKPVFLQYPSEQPLDIDSRVGKVHQVIHECEPFIPLRERL